MSFIKSLKSLIHKKEYVAFFQATKDGDLKKIEESINKRLDLEMPNDRSETVFLLAVFYNQIDIAKVLIQAGANVQIIELANKQNCFFFCKTMEMLNLLIENKVNLNHKDINKENILHHLANRPKVNESDDVLEIFKLLISKAVDARQNNKLGENVFDLAIKSRQDKLVKFLLTQDYKSNHSDAEQLLNAMYADYFKDSNITKMLIEHGFDYSFLSEAIMEAKSDPNHANTHDILDTMEQRVFDYIHIVEERKKLVSIMNDSSNLKDKIQSLREDSDSLNNTEIKSPKGKI